MPAGPLAGTAIALLCLACTGPLGLAQTPEEDTVMDIDDRRELFVTPALIDQREGDIRLMLHHPRRENVVLRADKPWEGNMAYMYVTVFRDGDVCRMYYKASHVDVAAMAGGGQAAADNPEVRVCYAQSRDGITWEKPDLGLYEFQGSKQNNIVWLGDGPDQKGVHGFAPFRDRRPDCPDAERYKALGAIRDATKGDMYAMASPDGIHWWLLQREPVLRQNVDGKFDSQNVAFWDTHRGEYRMYFRDVHGENYAKGYRGIKTARSDDFREWTDLQWLDFGDAPTEQLYTNQVQPYPEAPHLLVGFPARYVERPWSATIEALPETEHRRWRAAINPRFGTAITDTLFMASRDGRRFHRFGEAFLRPGPQQTGNWAYGDNYMAWGMIRTPASLTGAPDELSLYANEGYWRGEHSRIRRLTLRRDGFASLHAGAAGGSITTPPVHFTGIQLRLNIATSAAGGVRVALLDASRVPLPGYGVDDCDLILGNELDRVVTWQGQGDVSALAGQPIRLRFALQDADVYAFGFVR